MKVKATVAVKIAQEIVWEATSASEKYPPFNSAHEGYAVILEELDELKAEIFKKQSAYDLKAMRKEAIQVGAMALRFVSDICPDLPAHPSATQEQGE